MQGQDARLIQYQVLADHRLHFGRLYFQVIGINLALIVGAVTAVGVGKPEWWDAARLLAGVFLVGTALVAYRVNGQEERYASAMRDIEAKDQELMQLSRSRSLGARNLVIAGLALAGLLLSAEAAARLL